MTGRYGEPPQMTRGEYERIRTEGTADDLCAALVGLVFHEPSLPYARDECLRLSREGPPDIRIMAATCLGHLARIHGRLDSEAVLPALRTLLDDPRTRGAAENAIEDIALFAPDA